MVQRAEVLEEYYTARAGAPETLSRYESGERSGNSEKMKFREWTAETRDSAQCCLHKI